MIMRMSMTETATVTRAARRAGRAMIAAGLVALVCLGLGCSDRKLDLRNIEAILADRYAAETGAVVARVTCPEAVRTRKGDIFDCTVVFANGNEMTIEVEQLGGTTTRARPKPTTKATSGQ